MIQPITLQVLQLLLCYVYDHYHQFLQNTVHITIVINAINMTNYTKTKYQVAINALCLG